VRWDELKEGDWVLNELAPHDPRRSWLIVRTEGTLSWWMDMEGKLSAIELSAYPTAVPIDHTIVRGSQILQQGRPGSRTIKKT